MANHPNEQIKFIKNDDSSIKKEKAGLDFDATVKGKVF